MLHLPLHVHLAGAATLAPAALLPVWEFAGISEPLTQIGYLNKDLYLDVFHETVLNVRMCRFLSGTRSFPLSSLANTYFNTNSLRARLHCTLRPGRQENSVSTKWNYTLHPFPHKMDILTKIESLISRCLSRNRPPRSDVPVPVRDFAWIPKADTHPRTQPTSTQTACAQS